MLKVNPSTRRKANPEQAALWRGASKPEGRTLHEYSCNVRVKRSPHEFSIPPRGRSGTRPGILSREEVGRLLKAPRNLKHRALLTMTYGSGLRVSEVVRVRLRDVDRGRMMLRVEQGKGHKDRYTVLSAQALGLLEKLWRTYRPAEFFFTRRDGLGPICDGTAQSVYYAALRRSGVRRVGGIHVLRHCLRRRGHIFTFHYWNA